MSDQQAELSRRLRNEAKRVSRATEIEKAQRELTRRQLAGELPPDDEVERHLRALATALPKPTAEQDAAQATASARFSTLVCTNTGPTIREVLDSFIEAVDADSKPEDITDDIDATTDDIGELTSAINRQRDLRRRSTILEKALVAVTETVLDSRAIRVGDSIWRVTTRTQRKIVDTDYLHEWLGDDYAEVYPLNPSSRPRMTSLYQVAKRRGMTKRAVLDTFFHETQSAPSLSIVPIARAPMKYQELQEGDIG